MLTLALQFIVDRIGQFIRFSLAGLVSTGINYGALYLFFAVLSIEVIASTTIAFILSTATNFMLQKYWTFKDVRLEVMLKQLACYAGVALFMLAINDGILYTLTDMEKVNYLLAQVAATGVVSIVGVEATRRIFAPVGVAIDK